MSVYVAWPRVHPVAVDAYARRCLLNALIDHRRSAFARRERAHAELPEIDGAGPGRIDMQPTVFRALGRLPPRMRAAVVLRHLLDLSVEESAAALRCSTGTASRLVPAYGTLTAMVSAATQREGEHRRRRLSEEERRGQIIRGCVG